METGSPDAAAALSAPSAFSGRFRRWIGEPLTPDERASFAAETSDRDIRRTRVLAPLMLALNVTHVLVYRVSDSARATMGTAMLRWHQDLVSLHAATLPLAALISVVVYALPSSRLGRTIGPFAAAIYLVHGALASGVDQIVLGNVAAFTGYCFGIAVICGFPLRTAAWVYGTGTSALVLALFHYQADAALRESMLLNAATVVTTSLALNVLLDVARRRDFRQRRTIARQRDELASLNADLERRVDEQVAEIVRRAEEVSRLNAQLRSQIRVRSTELQLALSKLADRREADGLLRDGSVVGDRFEIGEKIGAGGMGVVYAARDRATGTTIAIKVIRPSPSLEMDAMRRFLAEAGVVASITHAAVVRMIHVDISADGLLYQAQELVDGITLEQQLHQDGPWPEASAARLGAVLADALAAAHERGVVHRDVKPANVMLVREAPGMKLLDFGLAKLHGEAVRGDDTRTGSRLMVGTPAYMAPEQVLLEHVGDRADVYAVGVLLFQVLSGRLAFDNDGSSRVMLKHAAGDAPDLREAVPGVSDEVAGLVAACLAKAPGARPPAAELARRLHAFADAHGAPPLDDIVRSADVPAGRDDAPLARSVSIARRLKGLTSAVMLAGWMSRR